MEVAAVAVRGGESVSFYDYKASLVIASERYPFYALIMAAMRQADTSNLNELKASFPDVWRELRERYNAPGGILASDKEYAV